MGLPPLRFDIGNLDCREQVAFGRAVQCLVVTDADESTAVPVPAITHGSGTLGPVDVVPLRSRAPELDDGKLCGCGEVEINLDPLAVELPILVRICAHPG